MANHITYVFDGLGSLIIRRVWNILSVLSPKTFGTKYKSRVWLEVPWYMWEGNIWACTHTHTHTLGCHWNKGSWMNIGQHCMHTSDPIHNYSKAVKIISNCTHKQAYLLNNTMFPLMNNTITRSVIIVLEYSLLHTHNIICSHNLSMCMWVSFLLCV